MPFLRKTSSCGLFLRGGQRVGRDVVDRLLAFLHARLVVGQRNAGASRLRGGEAQQLGQALAVGEVLAQAFLQHRAELARRTWRTCPCPPRCASSFSAWPGLPACPARAWCGLRGSPSRRGFPAAVRG